MATDLKTDLDVMSSPAAIHIVSPAEFDPGTAQTPGSERRAAIAPALGIASAIWGGLFEVTPGSRTGIHHHGEQETIAYVLEGEVRSKVGDDPEKTYATGQMFLETPNQLHAVSGNASKTKPARLLAVMLAEKGKQLTTPA